LNSKFPSNKENHKLNAGTRKWKVMGKHI
jgi:hypothetical protein